MQSSAVPVACLVSFVCDIVFDGDARPVFFVCDIVFDGDQTKVVRYSAMVQCILLRVGAGTAEV